MIELKDLLLNNYKILIFCMIVIIVDTLTGISKAITNDTLSFTSTGLRKFIPKMLSYAGWLLLCISLQWCLNVPALIAGCICLILIELLSIKENLKDIPAMAKLLDYFIDLITNKKIESDEQDNEQIDLNTAILQNHYATLNEDSYNDSVSSTEDMY